MIISPIVVLNGLHVYRITIPCLESRQYQLANGEHEAVLTEGGRAGRQASIGVRCHRLSSSNRGWAGGQAGKYRR